MTVHPIASVCNLLNECIEVKKMLLHDSDIVSIITRLCDSCVESIAAGGKIIFAGNGGSFSDASHLSAELIGRFTRNRPPIASIVLGSNSSSLSAISNDFGYQNVFARELEALGRRQDVFIAISTSGNSLNIVEAVKTAQSLGMTTVAFTGETGGELNSLCECLKVPTNQTARIQECHIMLGHILCEVVESRLFRDIST